MNRSSESFKTRTDGDRTNQADRPDNTGSRAVTSKKLLILMGLVAGLGAVIAGAVVVVRAETGLSTAEKMMKRSAWRQARRALRRYLWLQPHDAAAHLKMAEALIRDNRLTQEESVFPAIKHLQEIDDSSPLGAVARTQEGRLTFLILHQPSRAERLFRRAIELDSDARDASYFMWKLLSMTERWYLCAPYFWKVYEQTPDRDKAVLLREWYLTEFSPGTANALLNRNMGFLTAGAETDLRRLSEFHRQEPDSPTNVSALARWYLRKRNFKQALELLETGSRPEGVFADRFFVATLVEALVETGHLDRAETVFDRWPEPHTGYEFWKWQGIIDDEIHRDDANAIAAYQKALDTWAGRMDWPTRHRMAHCFSRMGKRQRADQERKFANAVEKLMEPDVHKKLRIALAQLNRADQIRHIVRFYRKLHRNREARCWEQVIEQLPTLKSKLLER